MFMYKTIFQISILKTLRFNFHYFKFSDALKLPVLISHATVLKSLKGKVSLPDKIKPGLIKIGFESVGLFDRRISKGVWEVSAVGKVIFHGKAYFGSGSKVSVCGGQLHLGENFAITANSSIVCKKSIVFGNNCLISWDCLFMDTDFHKIYCKGRIQNVDKAISIGNNVWVGCQSMILKGSMIANDTIIAAGSIITTSLYKEKAIYGGSPLHILKENVSWER